MAEKWNALHRLVVITERLQDESMEMNIKVPDLVKKKFYWVTPAVKKFIKAQLFEKIEIIEIPYSVNSIESMLKPTVYYGDFGLVLDSKDYELSVEIKSDNIEFFDKAYIPSEGDFMYTFTRRARNWIKEKKTYGKGLDQCYGEILRFLGIRSKTSKDTSHEKDNKMTK
jgi:hypothetical protein